MDGITFSLIANDLLDSVCNLFKIVGLLYTLNL